MSYTSGHPSPSKSTPARAAMFVTGMANSYGIARLSKAF